MAGKGIHTYTAAEGTNVALGQGGSMLITVADEENTPPRGTVFTAFTAIGTSDVTFNTLTQEDTSLYFGTGGESLTFDTSSSTALLQAVNGIADTLAASGSYLFISDGSLWHMHSGGTDSRAKGLAAA